MIIELRAAGVDLEPRIYYVIADHKTIKKL
jgi:hypothetical protein